MQPGSPTPPQVLIVDDDDAIRALLTELIEDTGLVALSAAHGQEALDTLRQQALPPCLILLDLMMPVMNGWEFRQAQLADPGLAPIPVIVLSARPERHAGPEALAAAAYLQKPVDLVHLQQLVAQHCAAGGT
ncbi:MAG: response regulator [Chloroflexales bacterium]|nr:response regulator [Chloroflexales bacterium]